MEMEKAETGVTKRPRGGENMLSLKSGGGGGGRRKPDRAV